MVNRFDRNAPWQGRFSSLPMEQLAATLENAQQQYDTNYMFSENLRNTYISALPQAQLRADEIEKGWNKQIDDVVASYSGDYSQASKDLYKLQQQIKRDLLPGGEAYAIQTSYNNWQTEYQKNKERLAKGELTPLQMSLFQSTLNSYEHKLDPQTNTYSTYSPPTMVNAFNPDKMVMETAQSIKPKEITRSIPTLGKDGRWKYETKTVSEIDPNVVAQAVRDRLLATPELTSYITQLATLQGEDPTTTLSNYVEALATSAANTYGGRFKDVEQVKYEADPFVMQQRQFAQQRALADLKHQRDVELAAAKGELQLPQTPGDNLAMLAPTARKSQFQKVDPENPSVGGGINWQGIGIGLLTGPAGVGNVYSPSKKLSIPEILSNPSAYPEVNVPLLKSIQNSGKYSNPTDVWNVYNKSLDVHYGENIYYDKFRTTEAQQEEADRVIPLLSTGQVLVQKVNTKTGAVEEINDPAKITDLYTKMWDPNSRKAKVVSLGRTVSQAGDVNVGTVIPGLDNESYYIIAENTERMNRYNTDLRKRAFDFIKENREVGDLVYWQEGNEMKYAIGVMDHQLSTTPIGEVVFAPAPSWAAVTWEGTPGNSAYNVARTASGTPDYWVDEQTNTRFTPAHLEARILGNTRFDNFPVRPRSATKDFNNRIE